MNLDWLLLTDHVSWLEIAWTTVAAIGALYSCMLLGEVIADLRAVGTIHPRNGRHKMARGAVRQEAIRLSLHLTFVLIGLAAMSLQNQPIEGARVFVNAALIAVAAVQALGSYLDKQLRDELRERAMDPASLPDNVDLTPADPPQG